MRIAVCLSVVASACLPGWCAARRCVAEHVGDLKSSVVSVRVQAARRLALRHTFARSVDEILAVYRQITRSRRRAA